jgi:hypothetical protein
MTRRVRSEGIAQVVPELNRVRPRLVSDVAPRPNWNADFFISDEQDIDALLNDAARENVRAAWSDGSGTAGTGSVTTDGPGLYFDTGEGRKLTGQVRLSFSLYHVPVVVDCRLEDGRFVELTRVSSSESRTATRVVPATLTHLQWYSMTGEGMRVNRAPFLDLGVNGGRSCHAYGDPVPDDRVFPATILTDGELVHCMAEVRSRTSTHRGVELGLHFTAVDSIALSDVVQRSLFPEIVLRRKVPIAELDRLFRAAGYHRLRDGAMPTQEWAAMDADAITRDFVYLGRDRAAVAHGSMTRVYRNTWLGHQMAIRRDHPESTRARRIHTAMAMITSLIDGKDARLMAYYDATKSYGRVFFGHFAESVESPELAVVSDLDWIDRRAMPLVLDTEIPPHISASPATPCELGAIVDLVRRHLPSLQADAMDIHPSRLRCDALHPGYRASGLFRTREVFAVRVRGQVVGAALCEHTSPNLNLLNELNLAQFFFVRPGVEPRAQAALQHAVRRFYDVRGVPNPFVLAPTDTFDMSLDPHTWLAMRVRCITWSFEGLRAYENYLRLRCAWLERGQKPTLNGRISETLSAS